MEYGTSLGLAFTSGINAYLPLLSLALATNIWPDHFKLNPAFAFISLPWFMVILGILALLDLVADKIPAIDHAWDTIHTVLRPIAGAIAAGAATGGQIDNAWLPIILATGGGVAGATHLTKATTRGASSAFTGGVANPFISIVEDVFMAIGVLLSLIAPFLMLGVVILFVGIFLIMAPRIINKLIEMRNRRKQRLSMSGTTQSPGRF